MLLFWFGPQVTFRKNESPELPMDPENTRNTSPRIPLYNLGGASGNQTIVKFQSLAKQLFPSKKAILCSSWAAVPQSARWSLTRTLKEKLVRVAVPDEVRMDLSPHELLGSWASAELTVSSWRCNEAQGHQSPSPADRLLSTSHHSLIGPRAQLGRGIQALQLGVEVLISLPLLFLGRHLSPNPIFFLENRYFNG